MRREVGSGRRNDARDVIAVKRFLHDAGLYTMPCPAAPGPIYDSDLSLAIRVFQGRHGLKEDGVIRPAIWCSRLPMTPPTRAAGNSPSTSETGRSIFKIIPTW